MKHLYNQVMSVAGAFVCVLAFWAASSLNASDATAQIIIIAVPAATGLSLGFRTGLHGLTLPLYSISMMLTLAYFRVYPYYSTDFHWSGPPMLYSSFLVPSAVLPVLIVVVIRKTYRNKK